MNCLRTIVVATAMLVWAALHVAPAQDMLRYLDLKSDDFTKADMTRAEIEAVLRVDPAKPVDLSGRRLNGVDLSRLDLRRVKFQSARLNRANLAGANLDGVTLDQAWALGADLTGASLRGASLFATQLIGAKLDGADLSDARVTGDLSNASMKQARLDGADLSADMRNQSMGLMRGILRSADLDGASFENANLSRAVLEFASLRGANLKGAKLNGSDLGGANFQSAEVTDADFENADVTSTRLIGMRGRDKARNLDRVRNLDRALIETEAKQVQSEPTRTGKERLGGKASDEQRVDNCNVPIDLRGPTPRPHGCGEGTTINPGR